jgi:RNA polymerase sigma factor (sigma-70 family)
MSVQDQSFEEVLNQFTPLIKGQLKALNIYKDHENFYQIAMIALWEAYRNFSEEKGSFSAYAFGYVRGRLLTALKKSAVYEERNELQETFEEGGVEDDYLMKETIEAYLEHLTDNQRKWVTYYVFQQLTPTEIAEKENVSVEAVKSWRKQAIKKLRNVYS